ncbi:MAG: nitroreductase family protein [Serpentinimonas sp.]|nr:nitroreductase family protein [Serpentinimonas sp.]
MQLVLMQDHPVLDQGQWAQALIQGRRSTSPRRLCAPGPDAAQQQLILAAAAAAPDHGRILPWRLVEVPQALRARLGGAFAEALRERDPLASAEQLAQAAEKAQHAPWLLLALLRVGAPGAAGAVGAEIPEHERLLATGAALQNMLLQASALGFGSCLTSGQALQSGPLRRLFGLAPDERALCFLNIGHVAQPRALHQRPTVADYFSRLAPEPGGEVP